MSMIKTKKCPTCGKEFTTDKNAKKFCSDVCRYRSYAVSRSPKARCPICGRTFTLSKVRLEYCSVACRDKAHRQELQKQYAVRPAIERRKRIKTSLSLTEIAKLAREAGMTYGEYVARCEFE